MGKYLSNALLAALLFLASACSGLNDSGSPLVSGRQMDIATPSKWHTESKNYNKQHDSITTRPRPRMKPLMLAVASLSKSLKSQSNDNRMYPRTSDAIGPYKNDLNVSIPTGINFEQAKALLGPPDLQMNGMPSKIWLYISITCNVEMHFFFNIETEQYQLLYYNTKPTTLDNTSVFDVSPASSNCFEILTRGTDVDEFG